MKTAVTGPLAPGIPQRSTAALVTLFLCPGLLIYTVFMVWPVAQAAMFSFFDWNGFGWPTDFTGFRNFVSVLNDPLFWKAFGNNLYLIVFMMATVVPVALGLSVVIARRIPFAITFRLIFFLPYVLADLTAGLIWRYLLDGDYGNVLRSQPVWTGRSLCAGQSATGAYGGGGGDGVEELRLPPHPVRGRTAADRPFAL